MHKLAIIIFFVVFFKANVSAVFSISPDATVFHQTNDKILRTLDDLFISLKINQNFSKTKNAEEYLSQHSLIQEALCNNHKKYKELYDISKTKMSNKMAFYISNFNQVLDEMTRNETVGSSGIIQNGTDVHSPVDEIQKFVNLTRRFNLKIKTIASNITKLTSDEIDNVTYNGMSMTAGDNNAYLCLETTVIDQEKVRRVFEGTSTSIERYPFMLSVHVDDRFVCAGSLVHESLAISAASCLVSPARQNSFIQIRVASNYVGKMGILVNIEELIFHPEFDRASLANNLVILRANKALRFKKQRLVAIQYDRLDSSVLSRPNVNDIVILGWGWRKGAETERSDQENRPLSEGDLEIYDFSTCKYIYGSDFVTNKTFCGGFSERGAGACNHDAGGPALVGHVLAGVISFGSPQCGAAEAPTVFTRIGLYADWIDKIFLKVAQEFKYAIEPNTNNSRTELEEEVMYLDGALKDVYRQNLVVDDVLYGPIETLDDDGKTKISTRSFLRDYPSDPNMFPNPDLKANSSFAWPPTMEPVQVPEGYWKDESVEDNLDKENYESPKTIPQFSEVTNVDNDMIYEDGPPDIYSENVLSTTTELTTTKEAKENYYVNQNNEFMSTVLGCDPDNNLCKGGIQESDKSSNVLRNNTEILPLDNDIAVSTPIDEDKDVSAPALTTTEKMNEKDYVNQNEEYPSTSRGCVLKDTQCEENIKENLLESTTNSAMLSPTYLTHVTQLYQNLVPSRNPIRNTNAKQILRQLIGSTKPDVRAIIVLSDSGTTQRLVMHRANPLYRQGFKVLAAKLIKEQELVKRAT